MIFHEDRDGKLIIIIHVETDRVNEYISQIMDVFSLENFYRTIFYMHAHKIKISKQRTISKSQVEHIHLQKVTFFQKSTLENLKIFQISDFPLFIHQPEIKSFITLFSHLIIQFCINFIEFLSIHHFTKFVMDHDFFKKQLNRFLSDFFLMVQTNF